MATIVGPIIVAENTWIAKPDSSGALQSQETVGDAPSSRQCTAQALFNRGHRRRPRNRGPPHALGAQLDSCQFDIATARRLRSPIVRSRIFTQGDLGRLSTIRVEFSQP